MNNVSWEEWQNVSEREFKDFNNRTNDTMDLTSMYSDTFNKCMVEVVPKKQVRVSGRRKRPPWYNKEVQRARHEVNIVRKSYKRCDANNFDRIKTKRR